MNAFINKLSVDHTEMIGDKASEIIKDSGQGIIGLTQTKLVADIYRALNRITGGDTKNVNDASIEQATKDIDQATKDTYKELLKRIS